MFSNSFPTTAEQIVLIFCKSQCVISGLTQMFQIYLYVPYVCVLLVKQISSHLKCICWSLLNCTLRQWKIMSSSAVTRLAGGSFFDPLWKNHLITAASDKTLTVCVLWVSVACCSDPLWGVDRTLWYYQSSSIYTYHFGFSASLC